MNASNKKKQGASYQNRTSETNLFGRAVSRGIGVGQILCLYGHKRQFYRVNLEESKIPRELHRFRAAVRLAKIQLKKIKAQQNGKISEAQASIFDTHSLLLEDNSLLSKIEGIIEDQKVNAEWAVKVVTDNLIGNFKIVSNEHLRERYIDVEDVADRLLTALGGGRKKNIRFGKNTVIVAKEVNPSTIIELSKSHPKAVVTEKGGWTSHTFILARELNLPAVTGIKGILRRVDLGETVIVDGFNGRVILNPTKDSIRQYKKQNGRKSEKVKDVFVANGKVSTLDGHEITIRANLDLIHNLSDPKQLETNGVGLYRSEFLFNPHKGFPSEKEQFESYRKIADLVGESGVKIRTFDLSVDQLIGENREKENNPALGLRAIRLSIANEKQFRIQLRALLRASFERNLNIVLPMISDVSEILFAKEILSQEKEKLHKKRIKYGNPRLGAMIEIPSALFMIEEIIQEVDFLNLGTNDLVQYLLAVDRDNETVADWFRTLHPAVLRSIKIVLNAAEKFEKTAIVCGEMAGSQVYAPILIGLGAKELSMNINSVERIGKIISSIAFEEAAEIARSLENSKSADETEGKVRHEYLKKWAHLFDMESLPKSKN